MTGPIAFVLKGYPRLSETFIAEEILGLERAGLDIRIIALRRPTDDRIHPVHREIAAPVAYLPEYLHEAPLRVLRALWRQRRVPGFKAACRLWLRDLRRDVSRNRFRRFGQALVLVDELPPEVRRLHAHFIHTPASVTRYAAMLAGLPWSCSAHAKDIWTSAEWELKEKLASSTWTVTCTRTGRDRLQALGGTRAPLHLIYHGVQFDRFRPLAALSSRRDGTEEVDPVRLLAVGRAVPKKGFDILLGALALLPASCSWRLTHIGGGPELKTLRAAAAELGLADRIDWLGPQDQVVVLGRYREADIFVLPCRVAADGDRDGLPNVLLEAQSQGLVCVSTDVAGVPELIEHGVNGLLVEPDSSDALGEALLGLMRDPDARRRLGRAGAERVASRFDATTSVAALATLLRSGRVAGPRQDNDLLATAAE